MQVNTSFVTINDDHQYDSIINIFTVLLFWMFETFIYYHGQANWYLEWHFDLLILWALSFSGELSKAEELLQGLKNRSGFLPCVFLGAVLMLISVILLHSCRLSKMIKKKRQLMQICMKVCWDCRFLFKI